MGWGGMGWGGISTRVGRVRYNRVVLGVVRTVG